MTRLSHMRTLLDEAFMPTHLRLKDESHLHAGHDGAQDPRGETHVLLEISSEKFKGLSPVQIHRLIYQELQNEFDNGLHALRISTKTL